MGFFLVYSWRGVPGTLNHFAVSELESSKDSSITLIPKGWFLIDRLFPGRSIPRISSRRLGFWTCKSLPMGAPGVIQEPELWFMNSVTLSRKANTLFVTVSLGNWHKFLSIVGFRVCYRSWWIVLGIVGRGSPGRPIQVIGKSWSFCSGTCKCTISLSFYLLYIFYLSSLMNLADFHWNGRWSSQRFSDESLWVQQVRFSPYWPVAIGSPTMTSMNMYYCTRRWNNHLVWC